MKSFTIYKKSTGAIRWAGTCPDEMFSIQLTDSENDGILEGTSDNAAQYVSEGVITARPENPATIDKTEISANGSDLATIYNLPNPSTVKLNGTSYEVTDGEFSFSVEVAGSYTVLCSSFPYLDKEFTVNAS